MRNKIKIKSAQLAKRLNLDIQSNAFLALVREIDKQNGLFISSVEADRIRMLPDKKTPVLDET